MGHDSVRRSLNSFEHVSMLKYCFFVARDFER